MPAGLQVFDENGALQMDLTSRVSRIVAIIGVGAGAGSYANDAFVTGQPYHYMTSDGNEFSFGGSVRKTVSFSGNVCTWSAGAATTLILGVY